LPGAASRLRGAAKDPRRQGRAAALLGRAMRLTRTVRDIVAVPDEQALWAAAAALEARRLLSHGRFDALLTSSFPYSAHLAGLALRRTGGPPWLAELRDPWAGARFRGHGSGSAARAAAPEGWGRDGPFAKATLVRPDHISWPTRISPTGKECSSCAGLAQLLPRWRVQLDWRLCQR
jgi:hypothetical protein